jgi:hypothetical protein
MADNVVLNPGSGGASARTVDNSVYTTSATATAQTQVIKNDFGGETGEALVTVTTPFPSAATGGYFVASPLNSSTTQLAAGATFTGTIEAIPTALSLSLNIPSDQSLFVTVNGYATSNPNSKISSQTVLVAANTGLNQAFTVNQNYCNVVVQNIGTATTTLLNINSQYGPIAATDDGGSAPVAIYGTGDLAGINLIEECIKGELPLNVTVTNPDKVDTLANGGVVPTDCQGWTLLSGQTITLDTTGYNSASIQSIAGIVTVTVSNVLSGPFQAQNILLCAASTGSPTNAVASGNAGVMSVPFRYIKLSLPLAAGNAAIVYLRSAQVPIFAGASGAPVNLNNIAGAAVSSGTAQIGVTVAAANAATNGITLGAPVIAAATPASNAIKGSAGRLMFLSVANSNTTGVWLKVFNAITATIGTTSPFLNIYCPPTGQTTLPIYDLGIYFSTGICFTVTGAIALLDTTAITASTCSISFTYI